jgi:pre-mRNA-processing factor 40
MEYCHAIIWRDCSWTVTVNFGVVMGFVPLVGSYFLVWTRSQWPAVCAVPP